MEKIKHDTLKEHIAKYATKKDCDYALLQFRNSEGICPICGYSVEKYYRMIHRSDEFLCRMCMRHFYMKAGTFLEDLQMDLPETMELIYMFLLSKNGLATKEIERSHGLSYTTVERLMGRLREQMGVTLSKIKFENTRVEIDESHVTIGPASTGQYKRKKKDKRGNPNVFGIVERNGPAKLFTIPGANAKVLYPIIKKNVDGDSVIVYTDEATWYKGLKKAGIKHHFTVNHSKKEYVRVEDGATTNSIEGLFSLLKKFLRGTYSSSDPKKMQNLLNEFAFRYTFRYHKDYGFSELFKATPSLADHYKPKPNAA